MLLNKKNAIITGAGAGLGKAIAIAFAREGADVAVVDMNPELSNDTKQIIINNGGQAFALPCDCTDELSVEAMVKRVAESMDRIDILVNVVGGVVEGTVITHTLAEWRKLIDLNITSAFLVSHYVSPIMITSRGGVILNMSSELGLKAIKKRCAYGASKAGVIGLTRSMAVDLAEYNIRVNALCPGTIMTTGIKSFVENSSDPDAMMKEFKSRRLTDYLGREEDISELAVFLCSDKATYFNGAMISVDGGSTCK